MTARSRTQSILANPFDRFVLTPGVVAWVYEYRNREPLSFTSLTSSSLEFGVQLAGTWTRVGMWSGTQCFGPGEIVTIGQGEFHSYRFQSEPSVSGIQVGFSIYPNEVARWRGLRGELRCGTIGRGAARRLRATAEYIREVRARGEAIETRLGEEVLAWVDSCAEESRDDAVTRARRELDETIGHPLYARHIAELAGMHQKRLARAFRARCGVTPTGYRLEQRINAAVRLAWSEPERTLAEIALDVGFEDVSYLHRACMRKRRLTPGDLGRRTLKRIA